MQQLIQTIKNVIGKQQELPFSVYSSLREQHILNVPVIKPLLICILDGYKKLGHQGEVDCPPGSFIFLSNSPNIDMRNIPSDNEYFALLIEFEAKDFDCLPHQTDNTELHFQSNIEMILENTLLQFVKWSAFAPPDIWHIRRQEILQVLFYLGHIEVCGAMKSPRISHKLQTLISQDIAVNLGVAQLASRLAMSESTLRRKLYEEGTSVQSIKANVRLGHGLHLVQNRGVKSIS